MNSISLDYSTNPNLQALARVVRSLRAGAGEAECLLIGAAARDLWLKHGYGIDTGRQTLDADFGVAVADWEAFGRVRDALIGSGEFAPRPGPSSHRLRHRDGLPLDLIPFGGVERADRTIAWPPAHAEVFDCFGLQEALADSSVARLPEGASVRVASIPALALLKITAWRDRKYEGRDAKDLFLYLRRFLDCGQFELAVAECPDLFDREEFDYEVSSARWLGRRMSALVSAEAAVRLLEIVAGETDPAGTALLGHQSGLELSHACRLIQALADELADATNPVSP